MRLTWDDLLVHAPDIEWNALLEPWSAWLNGRYRPVFMDRLGCVYVERPTGQVDMLDVMYGQVETLASTRAEFDGKMNDPIWQEALLGARFVYAMHEAGKRPGPHECYAVAPPPIVSGSDPREAPLDPDNVQVMSIRVWHSICRQVLGGPA